jgi:hypothetical protein
MPATLQRLVVAAAFIDDSRILPAGEFFRDTVSGVTKMGDGTSTWSQLQGLTVGGIRTIAATGTVDYTTDRGAIIQCATDNGVLTLPAISTVQAGFRVKFQNTGADGGAKISLSPAAADNIVGQTFAGADVGGVANKDMINTKASAIKGDWLEVIADGTTTWWIINIKGVWAAEA